MLGYAAFQAPGGRLADRFGPRRIVRLRHHLVGRLHRPDRPCAARHGRRDLRADRACASRWGSGEAVVYPASNRLVAKWIPSGERGIANGLIFCGVGAGAGITPPLITYIIGALRLALVVLGQRALGLAAGVIWYLLARDTPAEHPWITPEESAKIAAGLPEPAAKVESAALERIFGSREVLAMSLSYFAYGYAAWIFFSWFFIYLQQGARAGSEVELATTACCRLSAWRPARSFGGWISDRLTLRYGKRVGRCGIAVVGIGAGGHLHRAAARRWQSPATGQHRAGRRRGRALSGAEFVLVGNRRPGGIVGRVGFGRDEHGRADRRGGDGIADAADREQPGMVGVVPDGGGSVRGGLAGSGWRSIPSGGWRRPESGGRPLHSYSSGRCLIRSPSCSK